MGQKKIVSLPPLKQKTTRMDNVTLEQKVIAIIDQIRPYLQQDGGDIEFIQLRPDNVVEVKLQGACGSCPHAKMTLKNGVEQTLKQYGAVSPQTAHEMIEGLLKLSDCAISSTGICIVYNLGANGDKSFLGS